MEIDNDERDRIGVNVHVIFNGYIRVGYRTEELLCACIRQMLAVNRCSISSALGAFGLERELFNWDFCLSWLDGEVQECESHGSHTVFVHEILNIFLTIDCNQVVEGRFVNLLRHLLHKGFTRLTKVVSSENAAFATSFEQRLYLQESVGSVMCDRAKRL